MNKILQKVKEDVDNGSSNKLQSIKLLLEYCLDLEERLKQMQRQIDNLDSENSLHRPLSI